MSPHRQTSILIELFAKHRVAANLAMSIMILGGIWTLKNVPTQLDPPSPQPYVVVEVEWRSASAEDIEELVTTPIEQQIRTVNNLRELRSRTMNGFVQVIAEFNMDADMVLALDTVKQRVANIRNLPPDIEPPIVRRFIDMEPIASILVTGPGTIGDLIPLVRGMEKDLMTRGVAAVEYDGLPEEEIALLTSAARLHELGMTLDELAVAIANVSQNVPAGTIGRGQGSRQLRSLDQKRDPIAFEQLHIDHGDQLVRVGDIADVVRRPRDGQPIVTREGRPAIQMTLMRETQFDAHRGEAIVQQWLKDVRPTLPAGVELSMSYDIWDMLGAQLKMIGNNAWSGLLLVVMTLFLFLNARVSWWVAVGVPVSCLLGLTMFHWVFGFGVSIIALIGFVMALGIVVDDAIVVGEDAVTLFESRRDADRSRDRRREADVRAGARVIADDACRVHPADALRWSDGRRDPRAADGPVLHHHCVPRRVLPRPAGPPEGLRSKRCAENRRRRNCARGSTPPSRGFLHRRFMPLARAAIDKPGVTLCAAIGAMVCGISLVASQHVGIHFVTGFDFESIKADVEFSAAASDREKHAFIAQLEDTLRQTDQQFGSRQISTAGRRSRTSPNSIANVKPAFSTCRLPRRMRSRNRAASNPRCSRKSWRDKIQQPAYVEQLYVGVEGGANNGQPDITSRAARRQPRVGQSRRRRARARARRLSGRVERPRRSAVWQRSTDLRSSRLPAAVWV